MKLCRFLLTDQPEAARSGVFHDNRVYETDGNNAIGIHDLSKIKFLPPVGTPPSLRVFEPDGTYTYANPAGMLGAVDEFELPAGVTSLEVESRVGIVMRDHATRIELGEAVGMMIGLTNVMRFRVPGQSALDAPIAIGPFLHTIDEFPELESEAGNLPWRWELIVNQAQRFANEESLTLSPAQAVLAATRTNFVNPGDIIALPALASPGLAESSLGRSLEEGDTVQLGFERLGLLTVIIG